MFLEFLSDVLLIGGYMGMIPDLEQFCLCAFLFLLRKELKPEQHTNDNLDT